MELKRGAITTAVLVAGVMAAQGIYAQPGPGRGQGPGGFALPGVDADRDGLITRAEVAAAVDARFIELDTDGDGAISRDEIRARLEERRAGRQEQMQGLAEQRFDSIDADGDGALSLAELQAVRPGLTQERFALLDRNADGLITADERPPMGPRGGRRMGGPGPMGPNGQ